MKYCIIFMFLSFSAIAGLLDKYPDGKVTVRVVDEQGVPLKDVDVGIGVNFPKTTNPFDGQRSESIKGKTDNASLFASEFKALSRIVVWADSQSYYRSYKNFDFKSPVDGKYQPWNPTIDLVLRKKVNPVPMYAKKFNDIIIPVVSEPVGYDLLMGDWVKPRGKGELGDVIFTLKREFKDESNFESTLEVSMPNEAEGFSAITSDMMIPESEFKFPREAPVEGYVKSLLLSYSASSATPNDSGFVSGYKRTSSLIASDYFIRIRLQSDDKGNTVRAIYGKIAGPIEYRIQECKTATIRFTYYINPDGTRNIEFDPTKNLFIPKGANKSRFEYDSYNISQP